MTQHDFRIHPRDALVAFRSLLRDPDDTKQFFLLVQALSGRAPQRLLGRFKRTAEGRRLLAERPDILATLSNTAALEALPANSLGRAYLAFLRSEGITPEGLVSASEVGNEFDDPEMQYLHQRLRDSHDLWHTVTGYKGDIVGEAALLAFTFAQIRNPALFLLVFGGILRVGAFGPAAGTVVRGLVRGWRAAWLLGADWEALLSEPLEDVRRRLGVDPPEPYEQLRTSELSGDGLLDLREPQVEA